MEIIYLSIYLIHFAVHLKLTQHITTDQAQLFIDTKEKKASELIEKEKAFGTKKSNCQGSFLLPYSG